MNRTYTRCLTLRIEPNIDDALTEAAHDRRITKSDWIRSAIRRSLKDQETASTRGARQ
jgi:predicted HicB family RNase H-like nuclease